MMMHVIQRGVCLSMTGCAALLAVSAEVPQIDFSRRAGTIRRELFSSGLGGQLTGAQSGKLADIKPLGLYAARTHDWALCNPGQRMCDTHFIFPLLHADTEDERNYFFGPTDEILKQTIEYLDMNVMYRMGTSIESVNARRKKKEWMGQKEKDDGTVEWELPGYYNCVEPSDWGQYAKALSHIIRHYTQGWANGFRWADRIRYWELWNEPNDRPGGSWLNADRNTDKAANYARFNEFFIYTLKRLKAEFPDLKFGGPATCYYDEPFLRNLLAKCRELGYTPDFVSWHGYSDDPDEMVGNIPRARKLCDEYGFKDVELVINEWHYIPYKDVWFDFGKGPAKYAEITTGTNGLTSAEAGVFALQVFMGVQGSCLSQNYYYGCGYNYGGSWGVRNLDGSLNKTYYALKAFGEVVKTCKDYVETSGMGAGVRAFGGVSEDGRAVRLLVTDYRPSRDSFLVAVRGLEGYRLESVLLLDRTHDLCVAPDGSVVASDGVFMFRHANPGSAAWLLSFSKKGDRGGEGQNAPCLTAGGIRINGSTETNVECCVERDGHAVRYRLPMGRRLIESEDTVWNLPPDAKCWYQTAAGCYEDIHSSCLVQDVPQGKTLSLPITFKLTDGTYRMITEANLVDYTDLAVVHEGNGRFRAVYYAEKGPFEQTGADTTPWRVMIEAKSLNDLFNCDLVRRLCPAPINARSVALHNPGRCIWQWLPAGNPVYAEQRDWYDKTAALGFEYYLIDAGWKDWRDGEKDQWACLKTAIDYGRTLGVKTAIWVDSKEMPTTERRRAYLEKVVEAGAVGIKIDFVPSCDSKWCKWYEETLADTAEMGLFVDFHGAVKPSGRERTWPHELAREAIRGHEWHVTRYKRVLPPEHDCILPFTRLVQGHGDYTPVVFQKDQLIHFTWPRQLAQGIVFACPFLCFGDYPQNYLDSPMIEIIRALAPVYEETIVLPGSEIGECVAMARRSGGKWFVAIENGAQPRCLDIPLGFLGGGKWRMLGYRDHPSGALDSCVRDEREVLGTDRIQVEIRSKGGFVALLRRQ